MLNNDMIENKQRPGNKSSVWRKFKATLIFMTYAKPYIAYIIPGILLMGFNIGYAILYAWIQQKYVDAVILKQVNTMTNLLIFAVFALLTAVISQYIGNFLRTYSMNLIERDISLKVYNHLNKIPLKRQQQFHSGDLVNRTTEDVNKSCSIITNVAYSTIAFFSFFIGALIYLAHINLIITLVVLITGPLAFIAGKFFDKKIQVISERIQATDASVRSVLQEAIQGIEILKIFNLSKVYHDKFIDKRNEQKELTQKKILLNIYRGGITGFTHEVMRIIAFFSICFLSFKSTITVGSALGFIYLIERVQTDFVGFSGALGSLHEGFGSVERISQILAIHSEDKHGYIDSSMDEMQAKAVDFVSDEIESDLQDECAIRFENVYFKHIEHDNSDSNLLFKNLNLSINKNEIVVIVGPSGSGKTTFARLCCGLYSPDSGNIKILGKCMSENLDYARTQISYVPQEPYLFSVSIKENIRHGLNDANEEDIIQSAKKANAHTFIDELHMKYETIVSKSGTSLSGGQRQRISIARAFIKDAPIIILDEATSALDNESERLIQNAISELVVDRTAIIIAHRLSTVRIATRILVFHNGEIEEDGTHEELINKGGLYAQLYSRQFKENV